ncbi:helix-turn-helix domain-containing protein [Rossellomorea vietnamensis]|uniref:Helix-turn-helix domain-containing protein n=1 Tax=Rossellomorea vietnamensis TaxID=218284 RepID=A0A6I6UKQ1_9BACI|nr:helix-turn-helix transcriptional regulator [Rossellomorea vietnamensis]QHE62598.1 helix-turn-helix domain-containing protein [Rossellomorea vietnamensis]
MLQETLSIGSRLRELRNARGLKQHEVAEEANINNSVYNKLENDNKSINVEELRKLSSYFGVGPEKIIGEDQEDPIIHYMTKHNKSLSEEAQEEVKNVLKMIDDMEGQISLFHGWF